MDLSSIKHITPEELTDFQPNLFIASLSHETRSTSIAKILNGISCRKVALCSHQQVKEYEFSNNLNYYRENGFEIIEVDERDLIDESIFEELPSREPRIVIDCTSMSQHLYYRIFRWFGEDNHFSSAQLRLAYSMTAFSERGAALKVKKVKDFLKVKNNSRKLKKVLLLGLGQEANVSDMICKIVKPDILYLFYADPPVEKQFVEKVFVNNHAVINMTPIRNLISYPVFNGQIIYQTLVDVVLPLRDEYSISIIPQGPKIFSMACMLLQMGYPDIVLSYPVFKRSLVQQDRITVGDPVVLDALFEAEE